MPTLKEVATGFVAPEKLNAADLDFLSVDMELKTLKGKNEQGEEYLYRAFVDGVKEYYVANSVIQQIQEILKLKPEAKKFTVKKTGSGLATRYKVEVLA